MDPVRHPRFSLVALITVIACGSPGYVLVEGSSRRLQKCPRALAGRHNGIIAYTIGNLIRFMVEGLLWQVLGRKTLQRKVNSLVSHCMVDGFGRIGPLLCREDQARPIPFVGVEQDPHMIERLGTVRFMQVADTITGGSLETTASGATA